ncbi:MAG: hypothetical protein ACRBBK_08455 [Paracoccaceae bacterium]
MINFGKPPLSCQNLPAHALLRPHPHPHGGPSPWRPIRMAALPHDGAKQASRAGKSGWQTAPV